MLKVQSPRSLIRPHPDSQVYYYTCVEMVGARIFASGTGYTHRVTMGSTGPTPPAVRGLYNVISRGGISAVKNMVAQEAHENFFNRDWEAGEDYNSDDEAAYCHGASGGPYC